MKAIGIDLGTTNSAAAYCEPDQRDPRILSTSAGENLTPSVVCVRRTADGTSEILVGRTALNYAVRAPEDTILSIKRLMGRDAADPQIEEIADRFNYRLVPGPDDDPRAHVLLADEVYSPAQISTLILEKIKKDAATALGEEITHAVITVPAYFTESQRSATREAGEAAGLVVKKIIDEPTAAALAFGVQAKEGERLRILVFDMGGGTFDISILQMVKNEQGQDHFVLLQVEGDNWLGGDDFDRKIVDKVVAWVREQTGEDPTQVGDKRFLLLAKDHAEKAKRALSGAEEADIVIPAAYRSSAGVVVDVVMTLRRDELAEMIQPFVDRSMALVQKALGEQELEVSEITDVLLVGGSTLTPLVYRTVEGFFGEDKVRRMQPMECVALGAGILATTLRGVECPKCQTINDEVATLCKNDECGHSLASGRAVSEGATIDEVTAMSLGIAAVEGDQQDVFVPIIPKGTSYPLREAMRKVFQPTGRRIRVPVYEGNHEVASRNAEQGVVEHELTEDIEPDLPVEVAFNYDRHRQLMVTISVPNTDFYKTTTLRHDHPRTDAPSTTGEEGDLDDDWEDKLAATLEFSHRFLDRYGSYMEGAESVNLKRNLDRAVALLGGSPSPSEGRRMTRILDLGVFNAGLATQLFLADQAIEGAAPEISQQLNEVAAMVRQSHQAGDLEAVEDQARFLKTLVAQVLKQQAGVEAVGDQEDHQGLLRLLRQ